MLVVGVDLPPFNSRKLEKSCEELIGRLNSDRECGLLFEQVISIIENSGIDLSKRQFKSESDTDTIIEQVKKNA